MQNNEFTALSMTVTAALPSLTAQHNQLLIKCSRKKISYCV